MGRLSTKLKNIVFNELGYKPSKSDYMHVNIVKKLGLKGSVNVYYKGKFIGSIKLI